MGFVFKDATNTPPSHEERQMEKKDWHNDEDYYKDIIWKQGMKISELENENRMMTLKLQQIANALDI